MFKSFFKEKEIKYRLSKAQEINPHLFSLLLEKIEFNKFLRCKKTVRQLLRKIFAIAIKNCIKGLFNYGLIKRINNLSNIKKKILFVAGLPTFNMVGMSIYLRKTGEYDTILITENPWLVNFFKQYFDNVYVCNSYYDIALILIASEPYIVHVQVSPQYYFLGVIAKCLSKASIIIAFNDIPSLDEDAECEVIVENRKKICERSDFAQLDLLSEEFFFKNADGIILTMNTFVAGDKLRLRYKSTIPLLEFPTYVCDEFLCDEEKYSRKDGKIHIVYGGIIASSDKSKELYSIIQFIDLAKKMTKQGICFHIYTSPHISPLQIKSLYLDYIQLAAETPNFSFKQGIPQDKAIKEFSKYDFAILSSLSYIEKVNTFHKNTMLQSKFFTYLSAGIPIIVTEEDGNSMSLVKKYEVGIVIKQNEIEYLSEIIKGYDYEKLRFNVRRAREELSMKKHIGRLIEFYEQVYATKTLKHEARQPKVLTT